MAGIGFFPLSPKITRMNTQATTTYQDRLGNPISKSQWDSLQSQRKATSPQGIRERMIADFTSQRNAANAANTARYNEGKGELSTLRTRNQNRLIGAGATAMADARNTGTQQIASNQQDMSRRGLGNTTIGQSVARGINESTSRAVGAIKESAAAAQSSADRADTNNLVSFIERRTDVGPNESAFLQAMQNLGASGGASSGRSSVFSTRSSGRSRLGASGMDEKQDYGLLDEQVAKHAAGRGIRGFNFAQQKGNRKSQNLSGYGMNDFSPDKGSRRVDKQGNPLRALNPWSKEAIDKDLDYVFGR